jgi:methylglyoxal synthase
MTDKVELPQQKRIALIAHDASKPDLLAWVKFNRENAWRCHRATHLPV